MLVKSSGGGQLLPIEFDEDACRKVNSWDDCFGSIMVIQVWCWMAILYRLVRVKPWFAVGPWWVKNPSWIGFILLLEGYVRFNNGPYVLLEKNISGEQLVWTCPGVFHHWCFVDHLLLLLLNELGFDFIIIPTRTNAFLPKSKNLYVSRSNIWSHCIKSKRGP